VCTHIRYLTYELSILPFSLEWLSIGSTDGFRCIRPSGNRDGVVALGKYPCKSADVAFAFDVPILAPAIERGGREREREKSKSLIKGNQTRWRGGRGERLNFAGHVFLGGCMSVSRQQYFTREYIRCEHL